MAKRAAVRGSKRAYLVKTMNACHLNEYQAVAKGGFFTRASTLRTPKSAGEEIVKTRYSVRNLMSWRSTLE